MRRIVEITEQLLRDLQPSDFDETQPPRVLIVEDDRNDSDMMVTTLLAMGCKVDLSRTGHDAIAIIKGRPGTPQLPWYSILFLDLKLPGPSGVEVLSFVKAYRPSLPVVIVTGTISDNYMLDEAAQLGYFGLIKKPLKRERITDIFLNHHIKLMPVNGHT